MAIKGYTFYLDGVKQNQVPQESPTYTFTGLASNTDHHIEVEVVDYANNVSTPGELDASTLAPTPGAPMGVSDTTAIDAIVNAAITTNGAAQRFTSANAGCIIGISCDKGDYYQAYGHDYGGNALTTDMKMRWGSCSKMATATLILAQIDAGHISLDDKLSQFVSGVPNGSIITIEHLLMMRSGIRDYLQEDSTHQQSYFLNPTQVVDPMPWIRSYAPLFVPGTKTQYSNSNYILLGSILEWCDLNYGTGRNVRTIVLEDYCQALGLTDTEWPLVGTNYLTQPYSRGGAFNQVYPTAQSLGFFAFLIPYFLPGAQLTPTIEFTAVSTSWAGSAGAMAGPIADFVKFGKALYNGDLISSDMKQLRNELFETYIEYPPDPAKPWIGDGWSGSGLGVFQFGAWLGWIGNIGGYMTALFFDYDNGAVIALMFNWLMFDVADLFYQIRYALYPDSVHTQPTIRRGIGGIASGESFGTAAAYVYHTPGDEDSHTDVPLKVPFYI